MDPKDRVETVAKTKAGAMREKGSSADDPAPGSAYRVAQADVDAIIESWPSAPKKVVEETIAQYGLPNEGTPTQLIWHDNGPWKRTVITSDETAHDFPTPHTDFITQTISYDVHAEKLRASSALSRPSTISCIRFMARKFAAPARDRVGRNLEVLANVGIARIPALIVGTHAGGHGAHRSHQPVPGGLHRRGRRAKRSSRPSTNRSRSQPCASLLRPRSGFAGIPEEGVHDAPDYQQDSRHSAE